MLDHVGLFLPSMARGSDAMERLGFALTPYTPQHRTADSGELVPTGTANRLAMLERGYIELLTPIGDTPLADQMRLAVDRYSGLHLIAFGTSDAEGIHGRLEQSGFTPLPMVRQRRHVPTDQGEQLARFSVVRVPPERMPEGRMQFCRHHTPELVWQTERLHHPNGAHSLTDVVMCVDNLDETANRYGLFLSTGVEEHSGVRVLSLGRGRLHLFGPDALASLSLPCPTRPFIACIVLTSNDLAATRAVLAQRAVVTREMAPGVLGATMPESIATSVLFTTPGASLPWLAS
ncbi:MAG: VOC family protein [Pseudomonadota bacterium]